MWVSFFLAIPAGEEFKRGFSGREIILQRKVFGLLALAFEREPLIFPWVRSARGAWCDSLGQRPREDVVEDAISAEGAK
jgi:hypothetical protein